MDEVRDMSDEQMVMGLGIVIVIICAIFSLLLSPTFIWGIAIGVVTMLIGYYFDEN